MKLPKSPKPLLDLFGSFKNQRMMELITRSGEFSTKDTYLHWDDLRHRPAPAGLTHEEWWFVLKFRREGSLRSIPLRDGKGHAFKFAVPDALAEQLHRIDCGAGTTFGLPSAVTNAETRNRYLINTLMDEAITSSQLEGAVTAYRVAKDMLRSGRPPGDKSERMILNNYGTMQRIIELRGQKLTPELVFELHRMVTRDTLDIVDGAGRFRTADEKIRVTDLDGQEVHVPPPAQQLPKRLKEMCAFANGETPDFFIHPAVRAMILHFWMGYDHPFVDGNGRAARALFYWSMLHSGFWFFEFVSISAILRKAPAKYALAFLHSETDENDLTYFILYQASVIERAIKHLHAYIEQKKTNLNESEKNLRRLAHLNHRQKALILHALKNPAKDYTIEAHRASHDVVYQTARTDLLSLEAQGLLQMRKSGKTLTFRASPDLEERLRVGDAFDNTLPLPLES